VRSVDALTGVAFVHRLVDDGQPSAAAEDFTTALLIDGDRAGLSVVFDHLAHRERLGGEESCVRCHHRNAPLDRGTPCSTCHVDMYSCTDTFDHDTHVSALEGNASCIRCHEPGRGAVTRSASTACTECHAKDMHHSFGPEADSRPEYAGRTDPGCVTCHATLRAHRFDAMPDRGAVDGIAPGYRHAMHRLCIDCHAATEAERGVDEPRLSRCAACHPRMETGRELPNTDGMVARLEPGK
jgi:hypothetical protein